MAQINLILDLKNKLQSKLKQANTQLSEWRQKHQQKLNDLTAAQDRFSSKGVAGMQAISSQMPMLGGALDILSNKYMIAAAGVAAIGYAMYKATDMAQQWHKGMECPHLFPIIKCVHAFCSYALHSPPLIYFFNQ